MARMLQYQQAAASSSQQYQQQASSTPSHQQQYQQAAASYPGSFPQSIEQPPDQVGGWRSGAVANNGSRLLLRFVAYQLET